MTRGETENRAHTPRANYYNGLKRDTEGADAVCPNARVTIPFFNAPLTPQQLLAIYVCSPNSEAQLIGGH